MTHVIFDLLRAQPASGSKFHGGGEYIKTVFKYYVDNYSKNNVNLEVCYNKNEFLDDWILDLIEDKSLKVYDVKNVHEIVDVLYTFNEESEVRFFAGLPYPYWNLTFPENIITIGTCHGLREIEKPNDDYEIEYFAGKRKLRFKIHQLLHSKQDYEKSVKVYENVIKKFKILITDSLHSLYSMKLNFPDNMKKKEIYIFYPLTQPLDGNLFKGISNCNDYIMMISANRWEKNSYRTVIALDDLYSKKLLNQKTHIFGNLPDCIRDKIKNKEMFVFFDYVSTSELENAYKNCSLLLFTTLNEGFGDVPMEAMKYGKTCLVSAVASLPEVYGESVYYCNPYDKMEMQNMLLQAIENPISVEKIKAKLDTFQYRLKSDLDELITLISGENNRR